MASPPPSSAFTSAAVHGLGAVTEPVVAAPKAIHFFLCFSPAVFHASAWLSLHPLLNISWKSETVELPGGVSVPDTNDKSSLHGSPGSSPPAPHPPSLPVHIFLPTLVPGAFLSVTKAQHLLLAT